MTNSYELPPYPDHATFRMIGAVFWLGLLVIIIPQWFVNPVDFSPEGALMKQKPEAVVASETAAQALVADATLLKGDEAESKSELYIETPLTIKAPTPDPAKVSSLHQQIQLKEAQADKTGKLVVDHNKESVRITATLTPPSVSREGKYWVQVASYTVEANALKYQEMFKKGGFPGRINTFIGKEGKTHYQIRVGPYADESSAQIAKKIVDEKFKTNAMVLLR